jgi:hypothetical protein
MNRKVKKCSPESRTRWIRYQYRYDLSDLQLGVHTIVATDNRCTFPVLCVAVPCPRLNGETVDAWTFFYQCLQFSTSCRKHTPIFTILSVRRTAWSIRARHDRITFSKSSHNTEKRKNTKNKPRNIKQQSCPAKEREVAATRTATRRALRPRARPVCKFRSAVSARRAS